MKKETALQNAIRAELSRVGIVRRNNVGTFFTAYGNPIVIGLPGESDLTLFQRGGKTVFIEIKTDKGRQSKQQKIFEKRVKELGFEYVIMKSLEDAERFIEEVENVGE
ncbi:MAG: VRR-NUC domain-containing protein [Clostridia bacterium]|nr:VRR-NUC domain-containing protein [Clostridia bacterium]